MERLLIDSLFSKYFSRVFHWNIQWTCSVLVLNETMQFSSALNLFDVQIKSKNFRIFRKEPKLLIVEAEIKVISAQHLGDWEQFFIVGVLYRVYNSGLVVQVGLQVSHRKAIIDQVTFDLYYSNNSISFQCKYSLQC